MGGNRGGGSTRRYNPLTGDWVLLSPGRLSRPWSGETGEGQDGVALESHDRSCPLCPGNRRASGDRNPDYRGVYLFDNDFPALSSDRQDSPTRSDSLLTCHAETGSCRVICYSEDHALTLARMSPEQVSSVIRATRDACIEIAREPSVRHIQVFENRGAMMGCSNPHPHGQIWSQSTPPSIPHREADSMRAYASTRGGNLLVDYLAEERRLAERVVLENEEFVVLVPYWAVWPFETMILPRRRYSWLSDFDDGLCEAFGDVLRRIVIRYDNLFQTDCPYSAGIHQQEIHSAPDPSFQLHMHLFPPLLRSATIRKYMVGYEMLAEPQRDLLPEEAAARLRSLADRRYWEPQ